MNLSSAPWDILGIQRSASQDEIKSAYKKLAAKYHPDRGGDELKFKEVAAAYEIMQSPQKIAEWERSNRRSHTNHTEWGNGNTSSHWGNDYDYNPWADMFGTSYTGRKKTVVYGEDISINQEITLDELYSGTKITVSYRKRSLCSTCNGNGTSDGSQPQKCEYCHGTGKTRSYRGQFVVEDTCPICQGSGIKESVSSCKTCQGKKFVYEYKTYTLLVEPGLKPTANGYIIEKMKIKGAGHEGDAGTVPGDLYVVITVKRGNSLFTLSGVDLFADITINAFEAILGCEKTVKTMSGSIILKIPAGASYGTTLKVAGKGIPIKGTDNFGDLMYTVNITMPKNLTQEQKDLCKKIIELGVN